jgi:hypothetical protein
MVLANTIVPHQTLRGLLTCACKADVYHGICHKTRAISLLLKQTKTSLGLLESRLSKLVDPLPPSLGPGQGARHICS